MTTFTTIPHYTLIKHSSSWADEFTVNKFMIVEGTHHSILEQKYKERIPKLKGEFYFGSNESFEASELCICDFTICEISPVERGVLANLLGTSYGVGPLEHIHESIMEMDEEAELEE